MTYKMNSFSKNGNYSSWEYWLFFHSKNLYALERCLQLFRICNISLSLYSKTFWLWNFPNVGSNRSESFWIIDKLSLQFNHSRINTLFLTLLSEIIWLGKKKKQLRIEWIWRFPLLVIFLYNSFLLLVSVKWQKDADDFPYHVFP